ncbi:hypothetical protein CTA1_11007 [Colletotrichum tanaceti]|uniref:Uncharacterized protein n=1 Tax=Colletotrichum tanaceti TaxID=1306861 RepID=A0A4U6XAW8_9PEZI|nr:hypothetical protein CTA1_11007 [Colletotrichum tanaceti]
MMSHPGLENAKNIMVQDSEYVTRGLLGENTETARSLRLRTTSTSTFTPSGRRCRCSTLLATASNTRTSYGSIRRSGTWPNPSSTLECHPSCRVKIPPYTGTTTTVNYPLLTVSSEAWTSTIKVPPMTLSKLGFEVMTLVEGNGPKIKRDGLNRRAFEDFWPVPATTAAWPVIIYNGPDGKASTASPKMAYPTPPPSVEPGAPPPQKGAWPALALRPRVAYALDPDEKLSDSSRDWMCQQAVEMPSMYDIDLLDCPNTKRPDNGLGQVPMGEGWGWDVPKISDTGAMILPGLVPPFGQIIGILGRMCEQPKQTKTSTTTQPSRPTESPPARADANQNTIKCFGSGHKMGNTRLRLGIESFCSNIGSDATPVNARGLTLNDRAAAGVLTAGYKRKDTKTLNQHDKISFNFEVLEGCAWTFDLGECTRYFKTVVDSCNCDGENGKQGGYGENNCIKWMTDPEYKW